MKNRDINYRLRKVYLKFYEIGMGKLIANLRISESKRLGLKEKFKEKMTFERNFEMNCLGTLGEIAVAKYLNQYWGGTVNTFHYLSDVGTNIEVRASVKKSQSLIVRDNDSPDAYYFLVIQLSEESYRIAGFIKGADAKKKKYYMSPNNRPKAYFIGQQDLIKPSLENLRKHGLIL